MALYDDGGVGFAQERIDEAKAFKIQQAKKQEKFAKKLTVFDGAVKGFNALINTAADAAELGFRTIVISDATRGVNLQKGDVDRALVALQEQGVRILLSSELPLSVT